MSLDALISQYFHLEDRLRRAMSTEASSSERAEGLRRLADTFEEIERYVPQTTSEQRDQVNFFLLRAIAGPGRALDGQNVGIAPNLSLRNIARMPRLEARHRTRPSTADQRASELIEYVCGSDERVSLLDDRYRYVATSRPNATFYGSRPARMIGISIRKMAPGPDYFARMKVYLDACLAGEGQEYYYELQKDGSVRIMRCQMKPVRLRKDLRCVLIYTRDVTEEIAHIHQNLLEPLSVADKPSARPEQSP